MKKLNILLTLFLALTFFKFTTCAFGFEEKTAVRVGISNQAFSSYIHTDAKFSSQNIIKITDMSQNTQIDNIEAQKIIEITLSDKGLFNISIDDELKYENLQGPLLLNSNAPLEILGLNRKGNPAKYKGMIELKITKDNKTFNIINIVDLDNYLRGVVPNEMPVSFGKEALKAQAVAAKNYVTNAKISSDYDVVDSTASQVYYGYNSYNSVADSAIEETKGIYALYKGEPISALYYSTSAGISDDWDDVYNNGVKSNKYPYLKAKYETTTKPLKSEKDVIDFYSSKHGFDTNSPKFRWRVDFERRELEEVLHNTLLAQSSTGLVEPKYAPDNKIYGLKEIKPLKRTQSGKITELQIVAQNGEYKIKKELTIRRIFKKNNSMLPSANFFVEDNGLETLSQQEETNDKEIKLVLKDKIDDKTFEIYEKPVKEQHDKVKLFSRLDDIKTYPKTFSFIGGGFGHGVGMSQYGAYNLAKSGKKFSDILHFYYTDITLSTLIKTVLYNEYNISYKSEFYFDKKTFKSAYLVIDNKKRVSEFPFRINQYQFNSTKSISSNNVSKMDITKYLKNGLNVVEFAPLTAQNKGKFIKYRIEFI